MTDVRPMCERLRDDPQQERWMIAKYVESPITLSGEGTPIARIQGQDTSSQGMEVVPIEDLAAALADVHVLRGAAQAVVDAAPGYTAKGGSIWKLDHALDHLRDVLAKSEKGE